MNIKLLNDFDLSKIMFVLNGSVGVFIFKHFLS